jgi:N-acyl-D-amino-acid deacylase
MSAFQLMIKNSEIIDGTGSLRFKGSIGVKDGKIKILPADTAAAADRMIDGTGMITCPGFIDSHSHGDMILGTPYGSLAKINQGITTQVTGMCSYSMFPVSEKYWKTWADDCYLTLPEEGAPKEMKTFTSADAYFKYAKSLSIPENVLPLVGSGALRCAVMGDQNRVPTTAELDQMKGLLKEAMEAGAGGLSTGLIYIPSTYELPLEITELAKIVADYGGVYTTHIRDESTKSIEAIKEAIEVARQTGVRLIISHHKLQGKACWGWSKKTIALMEEARAEGIDISCDQYPYTACMSLLADCCPPKYYSKGLSGIVRYLEDPIAREKIHQEIIDDHSDYENYYKNSGGWSGIYVASSYKLPEAAHKTVEEYAKLIHEDPFDAYCKIMIANEGAAGAIYYTMCDEDLFRIISYPNTAVCTDGLLKSGHDMTHPRAYGAFPHAIRIFVKEKGILSLEEMVRKMTSLTANRYFIKNKGVIKDGYDADLLVFDYDKLTDNATYSNPMEICTGFKAVIVGGKVVFENQKMTGETPGKILLRQ